MNLDELEEFKLEIRKFIKKLEARTHLFSKKDSVYCLSTQMFAITKRPGPSTKG